MSDITTDFIKATNRILAKAAAILTHVEVIEGDVKSIREHSVEQPYKPNTDSNAGDPNKQPAASVRASDTSQSKGQKHQTQKQESYFRSQLEKWRKNIKKPRFQVELLAVLGLILYTCETRRTNNLTEKSVNLQFSLSRAFMQITGNDFGKNTFEDVQKAGQFYLELQNVGKSTASKIHGDFVVELPLANQEPSLSFTKYPNHNRMTHAPAYPGAPPASINLVFVSDYGSVSGIPPEVIQQLKDGTRYAVIFGRMDYEDSFGQWWTQFCGWRHYMPLANPPHLVGFATSTCIDFNIEGGSPKKK